MVVSGAVEVAVGEVEVAVDVASAGGAGGGTLAGAIKCLTECTIG